MENPDRYFIARFARQMFKEAYHFTATLPSSERFNLIAQMRSSATSIDDAVREGCSRQGDKAGLPFLYIANGSAGELYGQYKKCRDIAIGDQVMGKPYLRNAGRMVVMISRLIRVKEQ